MASNDIELKITVDAEGAIRVLDKFGNEVSEIEQDTRKASGGFSNMQAAIVSLEAGINIARQAFGLLKSGVSETFQILDQAGKVEALRKGFENLQSSVGVLADDSLKRLQESTNGLISDFDLMQSANQAVLLGVDDGSGKFQEMAGAAVKLGKAMGIDAKMSIDSLTVGLGRQSKLMLDNLGVILSVEDANQQWADANNRTVESMTEQERKLAFIYAGMEAVEENAAKLGDTQETGAVKASRFTAQMKNLTDEFAINFSQSQILQDALADLGETFETIDLAQVAKDAATVAAAFLKIAEAALKIIPPVTAAFKSISNGITDTLIDFSNWASGDPLGDFENEILKVVDLLSEDTPEAAKRAVRQFDLLGEAIYSLERSAIKDRLIVSLEDLRLTVLDAAKAHGILETAAEDLGGQSGGTSGLGAATQGAKVYQAEVEKIIKSVGTATQEVKKLSTAVEIETPKIISAAKIGEGEQGALWEDIFKVNESELKDLGDQAGSAVASGIIGAITPALEEAMDTWLDGGSFREKIPGMARGIFQGIADQIPVFGPIISAIYGPILEKQFEGLAGIGKSTEETKKGIKQFLNYGGLGNTFGLGNLLDEIGVFDSIFGSGSAGTAARKAADKWFADAFDANRVAVIINGQLAQVVDLVFKGETLFGGNVGYSPGESDNMWSDYLLGLPDDIKAGFIGVGTALEQTLGISEEISGQIAGVLANNIGGSLNNLQLLVKGLGLSAEEMSGAVVDAFLQGELSAAEAAGALQQVQMVMEDGIPGATGAVTEAFDNMVAAGSKGGLALVDAIQDIGFEAKELGITTLPQLQQHLLATGKYSADEIQKVMDALSSAGINTIDELTSATVEQLLPALGLLENQGFLKDTIKDMDELIKTVNSIPDRIEKRMKFRVETEYDNRTQDAINAGVFKSAAANLPKTQGMYP